MKNRGFAVAFAVAVSILAALAPFCVWQAWLGDALYDSVFSESLSSLPVMRAGRVMPASSAASDILRSVGGRTSAKIDGKKTSAVKWIWNVNASFDKTAAQKIFRTDNRDLQKTLGVDGRYYSYDDLLAKYDDIYKAASGEKSPYAAACASAIESGSDYAAAASAFGASLDGKKAGESLKNWRAAVETATSEFDKSRMEKRKPDVEKLSAASAYLQRLRFLSKFETPNAAVRVVPYSADSYETAVSAMLDRYLPAQPAAILADYAKIRDAIADGDNSRAEKILAELNFKLSKIDGLNRFKVKFENLVNALDPFFGGFILYGLSLLFFGMSGVFRSRAASICAAAAVFLLAGTVLQSAGILARIYIQMRPPVTNLYSSVVFTGCAAAIAGLAAYYKKRAVSFGFAGAIAGFASLLVAMNLPYSGDTMGMMRAVLNSNFWLTIHVMTIMTGYCGVFLAGFAAALRLLSNLFSRENFGLLTSESARGVYAVLCVSLVFSFAGTMLGGVWADMSWGRFWGWDPKENGALMVVLWTAAAIHARALKMVSDRVFLALAVFGNIVAAWAWFGVNLMGVGLHAYGFIEGGWRWFFVFVVSQLLILPLCLLKYNDKKSLAEQPKKA